MDTSGSFWWFALLPLLAFALGVLLGAWLWHRAGRGLSPLPSLPERKAEPPKLRTIGGI